MKICYIDTETTGLDAKACGIIQLAAIMEIDGEIVSEFETKIRPFDGCSISPEALAVSGTKMEGMTRLAWALYNGRRPTLWRRLKCRSKKWSERWYGWDIAKAFAK